MSNDRPEWSTQISMCEFIYSCTSFIYKETVIFMITRLFLYDIKLANAIKNKYTDM